MSKAWTKYIAETEPPVKVDTLWMRDLEKTLKRIPKKEVKKVVEVGCSSGRLLEWFNKYIPAKLYGIDTNAHGKAALQKRGVHFTKGDARALPYKNGFFDATFSFGLIEHFKKKERRKVLQEHVRVTRKGGYILITTPTLIRTSLMYWYLKLIDDRKHEYKHYNTSKRWVQRVLKEEGMEIISAQYSGWFFEPFHVPAFIKLPQTSQVMIILARKK